jgi:hypothetical protein
MPKILGTWLAEVEGSGSKVVRQKSESISERYTKSRKDWGYD